MYIGRSSAVRDAARERKAQAERDAGIPDRTDEDRRTEWPLDLRAVGGPNWLCVPRRGFVSYRVLDAVTRRVLFSAPPKTILDEARKLTPKVGVFH